MIKWRVSFGILDLHILFQFMDMNRAYNEIYLTSYSRVEQDVTEQSSPAASVPILRNLPSLNTDYFVKD